MGSQAPIVGYARGGVRMRPPKDLVPRYDIPKDVLREAYPRDGTAAQAVRDSLRKVRELLVELGLVGPVAKRLWKRLRLWDDPAPRTGPQRPDLCSGATFR